MRIKGYVGRLPQPRDLAEGVDILRRVFGAQFPDLSADEWQAWTGRAWEERGGQWLPTYDPRLARTLDGIGPDRPAPALWRQFEALGHVPVLVIRGERSDILSADTVAEMERRHPAVSTFIAENQGHTPILSDSASCQEVGRFLETVQRHMLSYSFNL